MYHCFGSEEDLALENRYLRPASFTDSRVEQSCPRHHETLLLHISIADMIWMIPNQYMLLSEP